MSHRVNVILEDEVWAMLSQLPRGERSRFVNQAVFDASLRRRRRSASDQLDALRGRLEPLDRTAVELIRDDRSRIQ